MLTTIDTVRKEATQKLDQSKRSQLGQFLTPVSIAEFMASLFIKNQLQEIHLLDAGAGIGSLTASFLEKITSKSKKVKVTAYEIDPILMTYLKDNLESYKNLLEQKGIILDSELHETDFIKDAALQIAKGIRQTISHAILNPPYKKLHSDSDHRKFLRLAHFETVNLYSAFVGLSIKLLKDKGELVAIIPRSFCNGNYYKPFRYLITDYTAIKRIHLFESRTNAFKDDEVLQENIIIHLVKGEQQGDVTISLSEDASLQDWVEYSHSFEQIVKPNDAERFIHVPHHGENHLENSEAITYDLKDLSLQVSTGPVVDFRAKEYLYQEPVENSVPLLYPIHFNGKEIEWPKVSKKPNAIAVNAETAKMFYPNGFYTVVRRFSSKEEKQRIIARVINPNKLNYEFIGIENHLNVFHFNKKGLSEDIAYGLAAYLNSSYVDTHFRTFNGHTQVNAMDLRQMKYPSTSKLAKLGKWAKKLKDFDQAKIDQQIEKIL
jgi:adenine-specific DNA-methyltransferase